MIRLRILQDMMQSRKKHCRSFRFANVVAIPYSKKKLFTTMTNGVVKIANTIFGMTSGKTSWKVWMLMVETWKAIEGYEGLYEVSNLGRVKSLSRLRVKEHLLSQFKNHEGYKRVNLWKNNSSKKYSVHRLVAEAFIPNPESKPQVNHIDENKQNNSVENLEWVTAIENHNHGTLNARISKSLTNNPRKSKSVSAFDDEGNLICTYPSIYEASRQMGVCASSITSCIKGRNRMKHCCGFAWKFSEGGASVGNT